MSDHKQQYRTNLIEATSDRVIKTPKIKFTKRYYATDMMHEKEKSKGNPFDIFMYTTN